MNTPKTHTPAPPVTNTTRRKTLTHVISTFRIDKETYIGLLEQADIEDRSLQDTIRVLLRRLIKAKRKESNTATSA